MNNDNMNNELKFNDEAVELVEVLGEILKSRTQSIKTLLIEKNGERFVSLQKWWRRSADEPWLEGKGFHLSMDEVHNISSHLEKVIN